MHEIAHYLIANNKDILNKVHLDIALNDIANNQESIDIFKELSGITDDNQSKEFNRELAEEIMCDVYAKTKGEFEIDYKLPMAEKKIKELFDDLLKEVESNSKNAYKKYDNQGEAVNEGILKWAKDSKARIDEKVDGKLVKVYHTTTDSIKQFNVFDPRDTDYYRFGDNIVNYFTDDQDMSGSYSNSNYVKADTKKLSNLQEAKEYLEDYNLNLKNGEDSLQIVEDNGKYRLANAYDAALFDIIKEKYNSLTEDEINTLKKFNEAFKNLFDSKANVDTKQVNLLADKALEIEKKLKLDEIDGGKNFFNQYLNGDLWSLSDKTFNSEEDLLRNLKSYLSDKNHIQYSGYVNLKNPYIVDAEGRTWNKVEQKKGEKYEQIKNIPQDVKDNLSKLANEAEKKFKEIDKTFNESWYALNHIDLNKLEKDSKTYKLAEFLKIGENAERIDEFLNDWQVVLDDWQMLSLISDLHKQGIITDDSYKIAHNKNYFETAKKELNELLNQKVKYERLKKSDLGQSYNEYYEAEASFKELIDNYIKADEEHNHYRYANDVFTKMLYTDKQYTKEAEYVQYNLFQDNIDSIYYASKNNFDEKYLEDKYSDNKTTNDIVKKVIEINKNGANYDGVIIKNCIDYGGDAEKKYGAHNIYVTFNSNQFKAEDNKNPTSDPDMRYMTEKNDIAPVDISKEKQRVQNKIMSSSESTDIKNALLDQLRNVKTQEELETFKNDLSASGKYTFELSEKDKFRKYRNSKLDNKIIDDALNALKENNQGKRTKQEWLKVAKQIGLNANTKDIEAYAYKTWQDLRPNIKDNLNRQGQKYVSFTFQDWKNAIYNGSDANFIDWNYEGPKNNGLNSKYSKEFLDQVKKVTDKNSSYSDKIIDLEYMLSEYHLDKKDANPKSFEMEAERLYNSKNLYENLEENERLPIKNVAEEQDDNEYKKAKEQDAQEQKVKDRIYDEVFSIVDKNKNNPEKLRNIIQKLYNENEASDFSKEIGDTPESSLKRIEYSTKESVLFSLLHEKDMTNDVLYKAWKDDFKSESYTSAPISVSNKQNTTKNQSFDNSNEFTSVKETEAQISQFEFDESEKANKELEESEKLWEELNQEDITQDINYTEDEGISKVPIRKSSAEKNADMIKNSTQEANKLLKEFEVEMKNNKLTSLENATEISNSGNIYFDYSKPDFKQMMKGLDKHFEKGQLRLGINKQSDISSGYKLQAWDGNKWVTEGTKEFNQLEIKYPERRVNNSVQLFLDDDTTSPTMQYITDKRSKKNASITDIKDFLTQKLVNKGHYVDKLAKQTNNKELTYKYDKVLSSYAEAQYSIGVAQTNNKGEVIGKSLIEIFKPAQDAGLIKEFNDYLLNLHNIDRSGALKSIFGDKITALESKKIADKYEKAHPEFKSWAEDVYKFNQNELQNMVDAGFISEETKELFESMYGKYVPIHRDIEKVYQDLSDTTEEVAGANNPIKRAKGGEKAIINVQEAMAENVLKYKKAMRLNDLGYSLAQSLEIKINGTDITFSPDAIVTLQDSVIEQNDKGEYLYNVWRDGKLEQIPISKNLYESLRQDTLDSKIQSNEIARTILSPLEKASKLHRDMLTTYSIGFALNNPIKDFGDAMFYTKYSQSQFVKNYSKALNEIATKGSLYQKYLALGGMDNSYFEYGGKVQLKSKKGLAKVAEKIKQANNILETAPRLAEFISTLENGGSEAEAMYNASDITTNFKRGGEWTKVANKYGANFLNASVQGFDKYIRTFTNVNNVKDAVKLISRAILLGATPILLNSLIYGDDDDYEELESYLKDQYYLIKIGDGKFIRIPKGRAVATMSAVTRTFVDGISKGEWDFKNLGEEVGDLVAPNNPLKDNVLAPVIQVANNKTWYGTDLVPQRLQNQLPKNQYDATTDSFSIWLGQTFNMSPYKINYLIDQYSGGIGDVVLPMMTPQAENNIITDKFTTDAVMKNRNVGMFYDNLDKYEKLKNDPNASEEDTTKYKYLSKVSSQVSALYKQKREIQADKSLSDKEKKELVRDIQKEINAYTQSANDLLKKDYNTNTKWNMFTDGILSDTLRKSDGKSELQDALYVVDNGLATKEEYMNLYQASKNGGASLPTTKTLGELKNYNIKLKDYMNYKEGVKDFESDKDSEGDTIKGSLKAKKLSYIMSMNVSSATKDGLIKSQIGENLSYADIKLLGGNYETYINLSDKNKEIYMNYIKAGFNAKSLNSYFSNINKYTTKKDIFNYINSLKLSKGQKMLLFAKKYPSYAKSHKRQLFNYINSLKISKAQKQAIWAYLGF